MYNLQTLSHHIIAVLDTHNELTSPLQLEKITYLAFKHLVTNYTDHPITQKLIENYNNDPFLYGTQGPYVKSIYDEFKYYGALDILESYKLNDSLYQLHDLNNLIFTINHKNIFYIISKLPTKTNQNDQYTINEIINTRNNN